MRYNLFLLFIFSSIVLGSIYLGPVSIRVWMTILIILLLFRQGGVKGNRVISLLNTKILLIYGLFLFSMFISLTINGEIFEFGFFKRILAYYLVCIVSYIAVGYFVSNRDKMYKLVILLVLIATFNNVVAIFQFYGNSIAWFIGDVFGDVSKGIEFADSHSEIIGYSVIPGVFGDSVMSGFITAIITPCLFIIKNNKNRIMSKFIILLIAIINYYGCFVTQQRIAFILTILALVIVVLKYIKSHPSASILIILLLFALSGYLLSVFDTLEWGRLFSSENEDRFRLWSDAVIFIETHPLFGGPISFQHQAGMSSHNLFFDSYICAGIGGFILISIMWVWSIYISIKYIICGISSNVSDFTFILAVATFNTMVYGLFHNTSYLTGYNIIFILLALLLRSIQMDRITNFAK